MIDEKNWRYLAEKHLKITWSRAFKKLKKTQDGRDLTQDGGGGARPSWGGKGGDLRKRGWAFKREYRMQGREGTYAALTKGVGKAGRPEKGSGVRDTDSGT